MGVVDEDEFFRRDGLTGTNLQYHLLVDLMVDDDWITTEESGRGVRPLQRLHNHFNGSTLSKMSYI